MKLRSIRIDDETNNHRVVEGLARFAEAARAATVAVQRLSAAVAPLFPARGTFSGGSWVRR